MLHRASAVRAGDLAVASGERGGGSVLVAEIARKTTPEVRPSLRLATNGINVFPARSRDDETVSHLHSERQSEWNTCPQESLIAENRSIDWNEKGQNVILGRFP